MGNPEAAEVREIPLTQGRSAIVDVDDYASISRWKWYAAKRKNTWYAARTSYDAGRKETLFMHRVILGANPSTEIDHKDGDGLNNSRSNLRVASHVQNMWNRKRHSNNRSGRKGVSPAGVGWKAEISIAKQKIYLGYFSNPIAASNAYAEAAQKLYGEFCRK